MLEPAALGRETLRKVRFSSRSRNIVVLRMASSQEFAFCGVASEGIDPALSQYPPVAAGDYILKRIDDSMAYRKRA